MSKKTQTRNTILAGLGVLAGVGLLLVVLIPSGGEGEINIRIPSLSVISATIPSGTVPVGEIECKIRQITTVHSTSGAILDTIISDTLVGTPFVQLQFPIVQPNTLTEISYFVVSPKILCTQETGQRIIVQATQFQLSVSAQGHQFFPLSVFSPLTPIPQFSNHLNYGVGDSPPIPFVQGSQETTIHNFIVKQSDFEIYQDYPDFDFEFNLQFTIIGVMEIFYPDTVECPNCSQTKFKFLITADDINTFYTTTVLLAPPIILDTDGDGIVDEFDLCPTSAETFNGFQDSDGCPDTATSQTPVTTSEPDQATVTATNPIELEKTCRDTQLFGSGFAVENGEVVFVPFDEQLYLSELPICVAQCEVIGGDWSPEIGSVSGANGAVWHNGRCLIETDIVVEEMSPIEQIIEPITQFFEPEPIIETIIQEPSITIMPPPLFEPIITSEPETIFQIGEPLPPEILCPLGTTPILDDVGQLIECRPLQPTEQPPEIPPEPVDEFDPILLVILLVIIVVIFLALLAKTGKVKL